MAKGTFYQDGKTIDYTNGGASAIEYGEIIPLTTRIAVAGENIAVGETGSINVEGVFELPAVNNAAFAVGDALYWDAVAGKLTKTATSNTQAGWAAYAKAETGTTAYVKI